MVFSFTSRVNPDNNIKKYEVVFEPGSYEEVSKSYNQQGLELIGFAKKSELESDKLLVPVYKTPSIESAPSTKGFQAFMLKLVRNIGVIGNYAEMFTVALGVCLLVLNHYQKLFDEYYKKR